MASAILRKAWQGKWAVVTGASAGIGEAIAVELAEAGVNLVLTARRRERLDLLAERLRSRYSDSNPGDRRRPFLPQAPAADLRCDRGSRSAGGCLDQQRRLRRVWRVSPLQDGDAAGHGAGELHRCGSSHPPIPSRHGCAPPGCGHDRGVDRLLSACSLSRHVRSHQGLRSHAGRSIGRRNEASWSARERVMPWPYGIGVQPGFRSAARRPAKATISRARGPAWAGGSRPRQTLGHPLSSRAGCRFSPSDSSRARW